MAENFDNPQFGNFSIENTMEMGMGNADLLNDLMAPETATGSPDDIKNIADEPAPAPAPAKKEEPKEEQKDATVDIQNFLYGDDEPAEDDEEEAPAAPAKKESKKEEEPQNTTEEEETEEEQVSQFTALSRDLFKLGVFSKEEDEEDVAISTPEEFLERFNQEKKKGAIEVVNNFIGQFGEDYQQAFDAIFVKGVNPKDYFGAYNQIQSFSEMDLSQENNQVAIIRQALSDQGFDPEDVDTEVERLKNYGDLETVATKSIPKGLTVVPDRRRHSHASQ